MSLFAGLEHIVREDEPLAPYTNLKLGGKAQYFAEPTTEGEIAELVRRATAAGLATRLIGGGTNLLVRDSGVSGLVIHLSATAFSTLTIEGNRMIVGGGVRLSHFVSSCAREGFDGPEHLVGIPGTIGGALHVNSGSDGVDIGSWCVAAKALTRTGELVQRGADALSFSYRSSSLNELAILEATFEFERENSESLTREMQRNWIVRRARQPSFGESAAYLFKDHLGEPAGELISRAGAKGLRAGAVQLFDANPNYLVAKEGAKVEDVLSLIEAVKAQVNDKIGVELALAMQIW